MIQPITTFQNLKKLQVINICTGSCLGKVSNLEIDLVLGRVIAIFVPRKGSFWDYFRHDFKRERRIAWSLIDRIGDDAILVRVSEEKL